ncbi:hypothetical protein BS50DRAFT_25854 [Corynespora cassiicola Philippines]|uniref:Uncharacterized protein n=1 Tax=Corynespora cassiicola Philippines TaxID=1448308 RepID=A0A2T2PB37_CORCC|nr:hypothetical protein BS50DRAFT_25854 [Corynespora cassiicola Philippines]
MSARREQSTLANPNEQLEWQYALISGRFETPWPLRSCKRARRRGLVLSGHWLRHSGRRAEECLLEPHRRRPSARGTTPARPLRITHGGMAPAHCVSWGEASRPLFFFKRPSPWLCLTPSLPCCGTPSP